MTDDLNDKDKKHRPPPKRDPKEKPGTATVGNQINTISIVDYRDQKRKR